MTKKVKVIINEDCKYFGIPMGTELEVTMKAEFAFIMGRDLMDAGADKELFNPDVNYCLMPSEFEVIG